jgi:endonuclease YncB( thermonuclease family)
MKATGIALLLFIMSPALASDLVSGKVTAVIDGNTVEVLADDQQTHRIQLSDIDSPELSQSFGEEARKELEKLVLHKTVTIEFKGKDRRGNALGIVLVKGKDDPRIALLKDGLAWTAEQNPDAALEVHRAQAQQKGKGLWKESNPTPPWTFRRQQTMLEAKSR